MHAINRGIAVEGIGTVLAGVWGSGNGTNTFGENVGAIGVTKVRQFRIGSFESFHIDTFRLQVGSRRVIQWAAGLMIVQGLVSKFGAVFIIIPEPIVGGLFCIMFGMISAFGITKSNSLCVDRWINCCLFAGLSALQYVNLNNARNLYIIGFSLFFPLVLSKWMEANPGAIQTGVEILDAVLTVLLSTSILVGGAIGCFLDNFVPGMRIYDLIYFHLLKCHRDISGTPEDRGLEAWSKEMSLGTADEDEEYVPNTFDFPIGMSTLRR